MSMVPKVGAIPQSSALAEARVDSISDTIASFDRHIMSGTLRSPAAVRDLGRIVDEMRAQRQRWEAAEASKPLKVGKGAAVVQRSLDELDL